MIERRPLRLDLVTALQERILHGRLAPCAAISEPTLAREFRVSRSPLREALFALEGRGLLESAAGRGFAVPPLDARDAEDAYTILATLDGLALRLAGVPPREDLDALNRINDRIRRAPRRARRLFDFDRNWHALLIARCPNRRLLDIIESLLAAVRRYDLAYWRDAGDVLVSHAEHREIVRLLRRGELELAERMLVDHWLRGIEPVVRWLVRQQSEPGRGQRVRSNSPAHRRAPSPT
ncbi:MAG: GntR family transcriptional regulator [Phycisphaerae bacterium]